MLCNLSINNNLLRNTPNTARQMQVVNACEVSKQMYYSVHFIPVREMIHVVQKLIFLSVSLM